MLPVGDAASADDDDDKQNNGIKAVNGFCV